MGEPMAKKKGSTSLTLKKKKEATGSVTFDAIEMFQMRSAEVASDGYESFLEARQEAAEVSLKVIVKNVAEMAFNEGVEWALSHPLPASARKQLARE